MPAPRADRIARIALPLLAAALVIAGPAWLWSRYADLVRLPLLLAEMGRWSAAGMGAALLALLAARRLGQRPPLLPSLSIVALLLGPALIWRADRAAAAAVELGKLKSDLVWKEDPAIQAMVLLPGLRDAVVVVPDRPVLFEEMEGFDLSERITRRKAFHVSTNSLGMRVDNDGAPHEPDRPKTRFRVLLLGGSVTFGHGVEYPDTWGARLERSLSRAGTPVEVLNAGVPGRPPEATAAWALLNAPALQPDLVIYSEVPVFNCPDPPLRYVESVQRVAAALPGAKMAVILAPINPFLNFQAGMPPRADGRMAQLLAPVPLLDTSPPYFERAPASGVHLQRRDQRQQLVDRATGRLIVDVPDPGGLHPARAILDAFEADPTLHQPWFLDHAHVNEEGHAIFADLAEAWLRQQGLLPWQG